MQLAQGWSVNVDRGPDWLFAHLRWEQDVADEPTELAENLWDLLQCHLGRRMVVDLSDGPRVSSYMLGQLVLLNKRMHKAGGVLRICGVPQSVRESIRAARLERLFPCYESCEAAVMGDRPRQPR